MTLSLTPSHIRETTRQEREEERRGDGGERGVGVDGGVVYWHLTLPLHTPNHTPTLRCSIRGPISSPPPMPNSELKTPINNAARRQINEE